MMLGHTPPLPNILAMIIVIFFAIGLHEYAHCKFADMAGDPTPRMYGRVTLNLFKHFDPLGSIMILFTVLNGFGIGWGRPAPVNPSKMRNPRWDWFVSVAAGPISNLIQATIFAFLFRLFGPTVAQSGGDVSEFLMLLMIYGVATNLGLFFFNLIPLGPLDGHRLVGLLLPEPQRWKWFQFNQQIGIFGLFGIILAAQFFGLSLTSGPVGWGFRLLTGLQL